MLGKTPARLSPAPLTDQARATSHLIAHRPSFPLGSYGTGMASGLPLSASKNTRTLLGWVLPTLLAACTSPGGAYRASPAFRGSDPLPSTSNMYEPSST